MTAENCSRRNLNLITHRTVFFHSFIFFTVNIEDDNKTQQLLQVKKIKFHATILSPFFLFLQNFFTSNGYAQFNLLVIFIGRELIKLISCLFNSCFLFIRCLLHIFQQRNMKKKSLLLIK